MVNEASEYPQLAKSIFYWLNYQKSVSRSDVLLENAIRFPLAEFIERRYMEKVNLEAHHPIYEGLRLDFCYKINSQQRNIEVKYLHDYSDRKAEFKRFFDDLVRLSLLDGINFFILCGPWELYHNKIIKEITTIDKNAIPQDGGKRPVKKDNKFGKILPLSRLGSVIDFNPFEFYSYVGSIENEERKIPDSLKKIHVCLVAKEDDRKNRSQVVYIWKVSKE